MEELSLDLDPTFLSTTSDSPNESSSPSSSFYQSSSPLPSTKTNTTFHQLAMKNFSYTINPETNAFTSCHCSNPKPKPANVLKSVSFAAHSSQILAVVGPSGAGKSTLLRAISGRIPSSKFDPRSISVDGRPVTSPEQLRRMCGFVTQEDNLLPLLTVRETLMFNAAFRLRGMSRPLREEKINGLMQEFGLHHVADSFVGGEERRGISGGERKRVSVAVDVIHDPPVLLVDEPTSGLDSSSALQIIELLSSMARAKRQILIITIHQPSYRILGYVSNFLLLSRGRVAHFGNLGALEETISELGFKIPVQLNALELAMEITRELEDHNAKFTTCPLAGQVEQKHVEPAIEQLDRSYRSRCDEIVSLSWRFSKIVYRTKQLFLARTMQAIVGGLGLGSVYLRVKADKDGVAERLGLFAFSLSFLLSSTVEALPIFLQERRVLMRESSRRMYRISSYMLANVAVSLPFLLVVALLFAIPVYWLVGLNPSLAAFSFFVLVVWLIVLMASSLVQFLSAVSSDFILGNSLICVFLGVFFLFSGYFIPKESIPKYWIFMYYVSIYRYPLDSLLINEYWSIRGKCFAWEGEGSGCALTGGDVLRSRGLERDTRWMNVGIMCGFFLIYRILCWIVLVRKAAKTKL